MYVYQEYDQRLLEERVAQYRDQTRRFLANELSEDEFLVLRLQNGLYIQRYAPMLRISVPYGLLASRQLRRLAHIVRTYDKGFCHVSTRQNIQLNWPSVEEVPDIWRNWPTYRCMPFRPVVTASAISPPTNSRALIPKRLKTRVLVRNHSPVVHVQSGIRLSAA